MQPKEIVVVGAGPAGMMAALRAVELGARVTLLEKNSTAGKKLLLSGKGRCNLTNACGKELFLKRFSRHGQFLRDAFKKFFNLELMDFFAKRGLKLKVERQERVFPLNDYSGSILEVLLEELAARKVEIIFESTAKEILIKDNAISSLLCCGGRQIPCERVILATGGISYAFTGSTGDGLKMAKQLGHTLAPLRPGLVPLVTSQAFVKGLEGLALKNIRLVFSGGKHKIVSEIGELLFTGFGVSGPLVLTLSGRVVDWLEEKKAVSLEIDLKPALSREQLDSRLLREFKLNARKEIKNALKELLPLRLIEVFLKLIPLDERTQANHVTQEQRRKIVALLKAFRLDIKRSLPIEEAMVTRGGVALKEIDPRTMQSRLIKGLYFAGEMIDIDADTGGFNLQAAFSTGYLAGESAGLQ